ncbi:MAG: YIP1 family protein [Thermomicrobium sp.]|nr:YIP1 family protein [Thermomicrobium sp.]MDW8006788.1 YIP1 family protein [Thermomicrobium sp.]
MKLELSIAVRMPEGGQMAQASVVERAIGAARLDPRAYEDVERDEAATGTALALVVLVAIANGIGNLGNNGVIGLIVGVIFGVIGFVLYAGIAYLVGAKLFATAETRVTWGQLIRTLGFAQAPGILYVLGILPVVGGLIRFVVGVWILVASIIAIRQACDFSTGRAVLTAVVAWITYFIFVALPATVLALLVS